MTSYGRKIYGVEYKGEIHAVMCFAYTNNVPRSVEELDKFSHDAFLQSAMRDQNIGQIAIAYTVWSKKKGGGKLIVKEVFKSDFGFTDNNINSFLNTKLLAQFIEELYMASAFYSYYFIPTSGTADRKNDFNHFSVLKQARIDIERAVKNPVLEPYPGLTSVLPSKKSEVIKLLALFVGRELTVSRALQDQSFTKKLEAAGIDYTPGDNLLLKVIHMVLF